MALQTFSNNDTPPASKLNALSNQTVVTCTHATRPTPVEGMICYEADTNHYFWFDGSVWKSFPMGVVNTVNGTGTGYPTGAISTSAVLVNGSAITFTNVANEIYRYSWTFGLAAVSGAGGAVVDVYAVRPRVNGTNVDNQKDVPVLISNVNTPVEGWYDISWTSAASRVLDLSVLRTIGSENGSIPPGGNFAVDHIGAF